MAVKTKSLMSLIGSMSPVEKAYFKKYGFKKDGSGKLKMLAMFDVFDKCATNGRIENIETLLEKEGIDRVALYRNRLFEALVQSLREFQAAKSDEEEVYHKYQIADLLINRGLLKEAESIMDKAIAKADDLLLLEHSMLLEHKRHIVLHGLGKRTLVSEGIEKRHKMAINIALQMRLAAIYEEVYSIQLQEGRSPKGVSVLRLKQLAKEVELIEIGMLDLKGTIQRFNILHTIFFNLGDNDRCLHYSNSVVDMFDKHPQFRASRIKPYMLSLYNYLSDSLNTHDPQLYLKNLPMLIGVGEETPALAKEVQMFLISLELDYLLLVGTQAEVLAFKEKHNAWYDKENTTMRINNLIDYFFRLAYLYYKVGLYNEALDQIVEFFSVGKIGLRPDLEMQISIVEITIHYELGNTSIAFYKQKALYQRYRNEIGAIAPLGQFMGCLGKLLRDNRKEKETTILQEYLDNAPAETDRNLFISPRLMVEKMMELYVKPI